MIITTIPTNLDFPNRGVLERDAFVNAQETAQDLLAGAYTTALNQYATELNSTQADINLKAEQVANQAVTGGYSQAYIDATFTPKILNTQTDKATPVDADLIPLSDSASSFGLKKLSWANLKATLISSFGVLISGLTAKATPVDADMIVIADSASSNASKKVTLANLKAMIFTNSALTGTPTAPTATVGTNTTQIATTAFVKNEIPNALNASGTAPIYACRAWVNFNGTGTVAIRTSGNMSSITDVNTGRYVLNTITAFADANYCATFGAKRQNETSNVAGSIAETNTPSTRTSSSLGITVSDSGTGYLDSDTICIALTR